jgi:fructokinase
MARPVVVGIGEVLWDLLPAGKQLGGAPANFAFHAGQLGAEAYVVSRVGDDELGREIVRRLDALGLNREFVQSDRDHPTGTVDVRLDANGVPSYVIHDGVAWDWITPTPAMLDLARRADAVCCGTLAQRTPGNAYAILQFLSATREDCLRVFDVNFRQRYYDADVVRHSLFASNVVKLNEDEVPVLTALLPRAVELRDFPRLFDLRVVALTRGPRGSVLFTKDGVYDHPGVPADVVDTVGAGDAFTAALVMGLLAGRPLDEINDSANRLAAFVCAQPGAMPRHPPAMT